MSDPRVVNAFKRALRDTGAGPKIGKALFEAGIVESGLRNLNYGDRDSKGALQQRPSQGWAHARNPYLAAIDFINHAKPIAHQYGRAGDLAQAVQRSAFPARYGQQQAQASQYLGGGAGPAGVGAGTTTATVRTPAATHLNVQQAIIDTLSQHPKNLASSVLNKLAYSPSYTTHTPARTITAKGSAPARSTAPAGGHVVNLDGKPVAAWIANILQQARAAGWTGTVSSGYRSVAEQRRIYNSGVRPAAKPGQSNHNFTAFPGGAVDVTNAQQLAAVLKKLGVTKLQWAGGKDPVHFSHPHGGGY